MNYVNYKKELLIKEYEILIPLLTENRAVEIKIRGWCIALWLMVFGSSIKLEVNNNISLLLSALLIATFLMLSLSQSYFVSKTRDRIFYVQDMLNKLYVLDDDEVNNIKTPNILVECTTKDAILITLSGFKYKNMLGFYFTISFISILSYVFILPKYI